MKYDDAEFCFLHFETDLEPQAGHTHIGMFLAWALLRGLGRPVGEDARWDAAVRELQARRITGGQFLATVCDAKLMDEDFNAEGNAFAAAYYERLYLADYETLFKADMPKTGHDTDDFCSLPDTWANFERLGAVLDRRYADWQAAQGRPHTQPPAERATEPRTLPDSQLAAAAIAYLGELEQRAERGDREAWFELAVEHLSGERLPRDMERAANALEQAAELGLPEAQYNLALCYQNGEGRPRDEKQMLRWFAFAAAGGHGEAAYFLAMAYRQGGALPQDAVAANALMLLAQERGIPEAGKAGLQEGFLAESMALVDRLREPGQLVTVLAARRRAGSHDKVDTAPAAPATPEAPAGLGTRLRALLPRWRR